MRFRSKAVTAVGATLALASLLTFAPSAGAEQSSNEQLKQGWMVFNRTCTVCHWPGVGGAPRVGDKVAWKPRIRAGKEQLYRNAIEGFKGNSGKKMPARGGNWNLTDDEVKAAVDYIVHNSQ